VGDRDVHCEVEACLVVWIEVFLGRWSETRSLVCRRRSPISYSVVLKEASEIM
jgi:hypothetical protein